MYPYFTYGIPKWDLGKSVRYLDTFKKPFLSCQNKEDIRTSMSDNMTDKMQKDLAGMQNKWVDTFGDILIHKFLDANYRTNDICAEWACDDGKEVFKGNPILVCMKAGIIPIVNTNYAKTYPYFRNWLAFLLQEVLDYQKKNRYATHQKRIWIVLDEIGEVFKYTSRNDNLLAKFNEIFVQGRGQNIGCLYSTTNFASLPENVKQNTTTLICAKIGGNDKEKLAIKKSFLLSTDEANQLMNLDISKREVMAFQNHPFVVYDKEGRRKQGRRIYRGFLIPPNCNTYRPKVTA